MNSSDAPQVIERSPMTPLKVLVVDDTPTNRQILAVFLKKLGHQTDMAENGQQAVDKFAAAAYDLVIMDVMMPVMDGFEATRRIRRINPKRWVPVLFLSALDKEENLVAGLESGGDDYLSKPVNFVVFEAKLRSLARTLVLQRELDDAVHFNQAVSDSLLDAIVTIDTAGVIHTVNPAACRIFGYAADEMVGLNVSQLMPEPHRSAHDGYLARYLSEGVPRIINQANRETEALHKDGSMLQVSLSVSEFTDQGRSMFVGTLRDISAQKEAERKLRENAAELQAYYDDREAENILAAEIFGQLMRRAGLDDHALHYWMVPATHFSGDIVAASRSDDGCFYVLLADATGHGLGAAISVLPVMTLFYNSIGAGLPLADLVAKINNQLREAMPVGRFVACTCLRIDPQQRQAGIWIGGMPSVLLIDSNGRLLSEICAADLPLGIDDMDARHLQIGSLDQIPPGAQLVLCSDGLIESENPAGEAFGGERLFAALAGSATGDRVTTVKQAVYAHLGDAVPHDDVTLMIIDL